MAEEVKVDQKLKINEVIVTARLNYDSGQFSEIKTTYDVTTNEIIHDSDHTPLICGCNQHKFCKEYDGEKQIDTISYTICVKFNSQYIVELSMSSLDFRKILYQGKYINNVEHIADVKDKLATVMFSYHKENLWYKFQDDIREYSSDTTFNYRSTFVDKDTPCFIISNRTVVYDSENKYVGEYVDDLDEDTKNIYHIKKEDDRYCDYRDYQKKKDHPVLNKDKMKDLKINTVFGVLPKMDELHKAFIDYLGIKEECDSGFKYDALNLSQKVYVFFLNDKKYSTDLQIVFNNLDCTLTDHYDLFDYHIGKEQLDDTTLLEHMRDFDRFYKDITDCKKKNKQCEYNSKYINIVRNKYNVKGIADVYMAIYVLDGRLYKMCHKDDEGLEAMVDDIDAEYISTQHYGTEHAKNVSNKDQDDNSDDD